MDHKRMKGVGPDPLPGSEERGERRINIAKTAERTAQIIVEGGAGDTDLVGPGRGLGRDREAGTEARRAAKSSNSVLTPTAPAAQPRVAWVPNRAGPGRRPRPDPVSGGKYKNQGPGTGL